MGVKLSKRRCLIAVLLLIFVSRVARAQEEPLCVENSPERRGEFGCSIVEIKPLPALEESVFWHIDRFETGERARAPVGPASIAFEAPWRVVADVGRTRNGRSAS